MDFKDITIVIPSYNPSSTLEEITDELISAGFDDIVVVNDGSDQEHLQPFKNIKMKKECTLLYHPINMGKGAALKTAFKLIEQTRTDKKGVITVDSDGQHKTSDIMKCAQAMEENYDCLIMGMRDFNESNVPKRNSFGNRATSSLLQVFFGLNLRDTQTGLRAIPMPYIPFMLVIPGNRFEYETNMLLEVRNRGIPFFEVPIETIYEEESKKSSQYRPFADSVRIFINVAKYAASSLFCTAIDLSIFMLSVHNFSEYLGVWTILCSTVIARLISSFTNFTINRRIVFKKKQAFGSQIIRFYSLVLTVMLASATGVWLLSLTFGGEHPVGILGVLKLLMDLMLFFLSYTVQRNWVFKQRADNKNQG